jgi:hypothetical protein
LEARRSEFFAKVRTANNSKAKKKLKNQVSLSCHHDGMKQKATV